MAGHRDLSFDQARTAARGAGSGRRAAPTTVAVADAAGAVLAGPLCARGDVPVADSSAMDGFAVRGPGPWTVVGRVLAGGRSACPLAEGHAVEVATGALVPEGTDRVLPVEVVTLGTAGPDAAPTGPAGPIAPAAPVAPVAPVAPAAPAAPAAPDRQLVRLEGPWPGRRHVRPRGEECSAGELLLPAGRRVTPGVLGLAASTGSDTLLVRRRPRVAALLTGDELVTAGLPVPGQVRDAVGPLLPAAVASIGGELVALARCGDAPGALDAALASLLAADHDVLVTCGMAGAGPADRLHPWLAEVGARLVVDGVAVRPGHPMVLAVLPDGRPLVGLPGNPLAAVAALLTLLNPLLDGMTGLQAVEAPHATLLGWESRGRPATVLLPVRRRADLAVEPAGRSGPAQLRGLAAADAVAVVPPGWAGGDLVELLPLP